MIPSAKVVHGDPTVQGYIGRKASNSLQHSVAATFQSSVPSNWAITFLFLSRTNFCTLHMTNHNRPLWEGRTERNPLGSQRAKINAWVTGCSTLPFSRTNDSIQHGEMPQPSDPNTWTPQAKGGKQELRLAFSFSYKAELLSYRKVMWSRLKVCHRQIWTPDEPQEQVKSKEG